MSALPTRKCIRLPQYDYAANGAYFVTVCTKDKRKILSDIVGAGLCARPQIQLSQIGEQVQKAIIYIVQKNYNVFVDTYVIMPNHIHLLLRFDRMTGGHGDPPLHKVIGELKSYTTHLYGAPLWQRSFYDHVIRGEQDYQEIQRYIEDNPLKWHLDRFFV